MSLAAIRAGLYTTFTACGPYLGSEVSTCDFGGLESTGAGSCLTFFPDGNSPLEPISFGTCNVFNYKREWHIGGTVWLRDGGTPTKILNEIWLAYDDLFNTIKKDASLNNSCQGAYLAQIANQFGNFVKMGGQVWKPINFTVIAFEF